MLKVLVVDDEKDILKVVKRTLTSRGYGVETYDSPIAALDMISSRAYPVAVLDEKIPGMKGTEVAKVIRSVQPTYIISMSGHIMHEDYAELIRCGIFDDCLQKPFDMDEFLKKVEKGIKVYETRVNGSK